MTKPPPITDAEFEVIDGPIRPGDSHPVRREWIFTGRQDRKGRSLWYRPPRLTRWQLFLAIILLFPLTAFAVTVAYRVADYLLP